MSEPIYLPDNWDTLEYECLTHNVNEAAKLGAKVFVREGRKELKVLRERISPPVKYRQPPPKPKSKPSPPLNPDRLVAEYEAMKYNVTEAVKLGATKYCKDGMKEIKRLKILIEKWVR